MNPASPRDPKPHSQRHGSSHSRSQSDRPHADRPRADRPRHDAQRPARAAEDAAHPAHPVGAQPQEPPPPAPRRFEDLGLSPPSLASIAAAGYTTPTPIQGLAIPPGLAGRDVIGCAATGTGKTAAFLLPILEKVRAGDGPTALILAPTRELVQQITENLRTLAAGRHDARPVRGVEIVGGLGMGPQVAGLRERREIIVATPGRLIDHLDQGTARLDGISILVLDEADRMLDLGFKPQLSKILARVPRQRQTMLFSATMGKEVADFARACLVDPVRVEIVKSGAVAARVEQRVFFVPQKAKPNLLLALLEQDEETTLVFTRTKHRAEKLAKQLDRAGYRAARIHGDRSQSQRQQALDGFKTGRFRILVATDVAARGLDVEEIGHVVCFDLSLVPEDHVHRIGRTARASASGRATSFCSPEEADLLRGIEKFTRMQLPRMPLPEGVADRLVAMEAAGAIPPSGAPRDHAPRDDHRPHPRAHGPRSHEPRPANPQQPARRPHDSDFGAGIGDGGDAASHREAPAADDRRHSDRPPHDDRRHSGERPAGGARQPSGHRPHPGRPVNRTIPDRNAPPFGGADQYRKRPYRGPATRSPYAGTGSHPRRDDGAPRDADRTSDRAPAPRDDRPRGPHPGARRGPRRDSDRG